MTIVFSLDEEVEINKEFLDAMGDSSEEAVKAAVNQVHAELKIPFEVEVIVLLSNNEYIHEVNRETRNIDRPTDVLSFPCLEFDEPADFSYIDEGERYYFSPDSEDLLLGDILISTDKVVEQAKEYGHSILREFSFLVVHSMLNLCGYDHMDSDGDTMEKLQAKILEDMNITRD